MLIYLLFFFQLKQTAFFRHDPLEYIKNQRLVRKDPRKFVHY